MIHAGTDRSLVELDASISELARERETAEPSVKMRLDEAVEKLMAERDRLRGLGDGVSSGARAQGGSGA